MIQKKDNIFAQNKTFTKNNQQVKDFVFDETVADVFLDMLNRSVPGYASVINQIGSFAKKFVVPNTNIYDLGCSLGTSTFAVRHAIKHQNCTIIAIDSSSSMVKRCKAALDRDVGITPVEVKCDDICNLKMKNASMIIMNYTLQFIETEHKNEIIKNIYDSLIDGGAFILSEKIVYQNDAMQKNIENLYFDLKKHNGYNDLEISQKRNALENVLKLETPQMHLNRLENIGFSTSFSWFNQLNFMSFLAVK